MGRKVSPIDERCAKLAACIGYEAAAKQLKIKKETVRRSCRRWKAAGNKLDIQARFIEAAPKVGARILVFDIETTPIKGYFWRTHDENIHPEQILEDSRVLCWAAKWVGADGVAFMRGDDWRDDKLVVSELADLMGTADIVVAHNGKAFDVAHVWTRMAMYGISPPPPFKVVDTLRLARQVFHFPHNSLAGLGRYLGLGEKKAHEGFSLWTKCMAGDKDAWGRMEGYNIQDVLLLESVYLRLRPYDKRHPNLALYYEDGGMRCVRCGSASLKESTKAAYTELSEFPMFQCNSCGAWCRSGARNKSESVKRTVL